jgi:GNAT superfamily N-acetyltransferase
MIRRSEDGDLDAILSVINAAAQAYRGVIPEDRWKEPYMRRAELIEEIESGVAFWVYQEVGVLDGVMGIQDVADVTLIRHAYVRPESQRHGIGSRLLAHLRRTTDRPVLIGTWADAAWAIRFYQKHGFRLIPPPEKGRLLRTYWSIPERQVETSVVLADDRWFREA